MDNLAPFGLKIGLSINLDINDGQNENKVLKVVAKIPNIWPIIGQVPLGRKDFKRYNEAIFYPKVKFLGIQNMNFQDESNGAKN